MNIKAFNWNSNQVFSFHEWLKYKTDSEATQWSQESLTSARLKGIKSLLMLHVFIPSLGTEEELGEQALTEFYGKDSYKIRCCKVPSGWMGQA